jgi:hypothetical protein
LEVKITESIQLFQGLSSALDKFDEQARVNSVEKYNWPISKESQERKDEKK